ncbi:uncharacterized protein F4812DRAFT_144549 [Daldinia caldariorum]|uniref:uncharacterized protein n=1 Tax=Daldinia caldariorum TaxID=326644 RepID=UPI002007773F|nr:uncharacterized protein F4812DRAFT_144549 [Daldinia caldariorum]KAI1464913.1 hypothetical protein F4812DRAFT_144549 [Daldinia caldariorum]
MADEYSFSPVVEDSFPGGLGGNHAIRSWIFGGLQYRPVSGTPLGRVVSQHSTMWNMNASQLAPGLMHRQGGSQGWGQGFYHGVNPLIGGRAIPNRSTSILPGWAQGQVYRGVFNQPPPEQQFEQHFDQAEPSSISPETLDPPEDEEQPLEHNFDYPTGSTVTISKRSDWDDDFDRRFDKDDTFVRMTRESLFRDIRAYLEQPYEEGDLPVSIRADCPTCSYQLAYYPPQKSAARFRGNITSNERMEVLPCGHIVGQDCMFEYRAQCLTDGKRIECPICQLPLVYRARSCGHPVSVYVVDRFTHFPPLTIPEGGRIPSRCAMCRADGLDPRLDWAWAEELPPPFPLNTRTHVPPRPVNAYNEVFFDD